ncbi:unnamed protein product [Cuscuta epithymum]|uniref:Formamidopyrimidine-DNA glycosylase catalytic domain-containing protein n=1 Tax=Cuscuta epithymum TaxID=186058 RepID=A0AAV0CF41_9ASTE|nr:unnamed protein product [Cuscuta epithymum]
MPELPEVEAARRAVEDNCKGLKIVKSKIADDPKVIDGVSPEDFEASLTGKSIVAAHRKGKNMWIQLDSPPFPTFQFGMAGAVYIKGVAVTKYKRSAVKDEDEWPSKYSKFFIELENGLELSFTDKRRFARVRLLENPVTVPPISDLGPDALLEPLTIEEFHQALSKKKIGIKALLLDQGFISGIGNWIADEVLYQARVHPMQIASSMSKASCVSLLKCIKEVTEFSVDVDADSSRFPSEWLFHYRWGKKPGKVNGKRIEFITAGGRTTAHVPELQKLSGPQSAKPSKKQEKVPKGEFTNADVDEEEAKSDENDRKSNSVKRSTNRKRGRKGNSDGDDNGSDNEGDEILKETRAKKPVGRNKLKEGRQDETDDNRKKITAKSKPVNDDVSSGGGDEENVSDTPKKPSKRAQPKIAKTSMKKAASTQKRKQSKKST